MITTDDILNFLKLWVNDAVDVTYVETMMKPIEVTSAWVYLGGSGARQRIYQLRDKIRVVFQFNGSDGLVSYGVYTSDKELKDENPADAVTGSQVVMILKF